MFFQQHGLSLMGPCLLAHIALLKDGPVTTRERDFL